MSEPVARGRIKVDARKALDKLRDHMLVDPHLWACEVARVAIALGATALDVTWTASDVTLQFDGRVLPIEQIAKARDHVLTPLDGPDGDALRSLGIGVGAALGLDAAFVEVTAGGQRVRFEDFEAEASTPMAGEGKLTRVQLRRRLGLGSITRAMSNEAPAEAVFLDIHVDRTRIALKMQGALRPKPAPPLVTVDLDVPGVTRAVLEVHDPSAVRAEVRFYEHGVLLTSLAAKPWGLTDLPLHYIIDAPRLPTNASRSQMQSDAELMRRVFERVLPAFRTAIAALRGEKTFGHDVTFGGGDTSNALGAIVAAVAVSADIPAEARELMSIPVVYDAVGRLVPLVSLGVAPLRVYTGAEPMPEALAPWLQGVLWKRGLAAERAVAHLPATSADDIVLPAKKAAERRARAMQHAASPPVVTPSDAMLRRESFKVGEGPFAGLHGEIAILKPGRMAKVRVFVDERALEEMPLTGVRLPVEIALAWPGRIVARFEYDAVERNSDLNLAAHAAIRIAALAIGGADPELARLALTAWATATAALNDDASPGALAETKIWRTNDNRLVGFDVIAAYARTTGALCFAKSANQANDGRLIVARADVDGLRPLLPKTQFVPYDDFLDAHPVLPESPIDVAILIQRGPFDGWIQPGMGRVRVYHSSTRITSEPWPSKYGFVDVVLVDRAAVPGVFASPIPDFAAEELKLLEKVVEACEQGRVDYEVAQVYLEACTEKLIDPVLKDRARALPAERERRRRERGRQEVLARKPFDLAERVGDLPRGTASNKMGAATVVLLTENRPPSAALLFRGHPVGIVTRWTLPLEVFIDVVDDALLDEHWSALNDVGVSWADAVVIDAALNLLFKLAQRDDFADTITALALLCRLASGAPARAGAIVQTVRWPTVQGGFAKLADDVSARVGGQRYEPWRTAEPASRYDAPAIHLPISHAGEARRKVLVAAGITLEDVTEPIARLQQFRGRSSQNPAPKLDGEPAHPLLRSSLAELGVTLGEGELELFDGDWSQVWKVDREGVRESVPLVLPFPMRVVCRTASEWFIGIERELQRAVWEHLQNIVTKADELPVFARKQLRRMLLSDPGKANEDAHVFPTTTGVWLSLRLVNAMSGLLAFTTGAPPFPPTEDVVLRLEESEANALAKVRPLANVTEKLKRIQRGIERRNAPPRDAAKLDDATRAKCLFVIDVDEEGVRGEVGFLHPNHAQSRGIELLLGLRPLAQILDPEGWPLVAVLDDAALVPDVAFEGLADVKKDQPRIHQILRRLVGPSINRWLKAPTPTLGVIRLPMPFLMRAIKGPTRTTAAIGVFWLPTEWPERPTVEVEGIGVSQADRLPSLAAAAGRHSRIVPVCGKVWVSADARQLPEALEHVMEWVALRLVPHVRAADARRVERYRWDLALIGALDEPGTDPLAELAHDRPDPDLMHVVARRAPQLVDKAVGDAPVADVLPMDVGEAPAAAPAPSTIDPPAESFLAGLIRRVVEVVAPTPAPIAASPLTKAVSEALKRMSLTGEPVLYVEPARRGRPVSYHRTERAVFINVSHPLVQKHAKDPNGVLFLVVAALSEINRELALVTDAEETAKLYDLLRANASD